MAKIIIVTDRVYFQADDIRSITMSENVMIQPNGKPKTTYYINIQTAMNPDPQNSQQQTGGFGYEDDMHINVHCLTLDDANKEMKEILAQFRDQRKDDVHLQNMFEKHFSEAITKGASSDGSTKRVRKTRGTKGSR